MDIIKATLKTHKLQEMKEFYGHQLGFELEQETANSFQISFGKSAIEFNNLDVDGSPFYHFACDIPSNQFHEAKQWVKSKTTLLTENGADEVDFQFLVAKSFYFEDPAGNIIEFIARLEDNPASASPFSLQSIQKLSEMGLVVHDKIPVGKLWHDYSILGRSDSNITNDSLSFMSDKQTKVYLLLAAPNRKWLFSEKVSTVFEIDILLDSGIHVGVNAAEDFYIED